MKMFRVKKESWGPIALIVLMVVSINSSVFFHGRTLLPIAPSYGVLPGAPYGYDGPLSKDLTTVDPAGSLNIGFVFDVYTVKTWLQGTFPFWNPYQALGQPLLANGISAVLYPLNVLNIVLPSAWYDLVYVLNWLLAAVFLYLYLRVLKLRMPEALVGAAVLITSGLYQLYLPLREYPAVVVWFPFLLYVVERVIREPQWRWGPLALGVGVYCSFAGGQPEVTFVNLLCIAVYAAVRLLLKPHQGWKSLIALFPGAVGGVLLAAPIWWTFLDYGLNAYSNHPDETAYGLAHLMPNIIPTYLYPYLYGHENLAPYIGGWVLVMGLFLSVASLGVFVRHRALCSVQERRVFALVWTLLLLMLAKMWGAPFINDIAQLPLFERIVYPRYGMYIASVLFGVTAAYGMRVLSQLKASQWMVWIGVWSVGAIGLWAYGAWTQWPLIQQNAVVSPPVAAFVIFGFGGILWALCIPLCLWFVHDRKPAQPNILALVAVISLLLQSIPYALHGYDLITLGVLSAASLLTTIVLVFVVATMSTLPCMSSLLAAGTCVVLLLSLAPALLSSNGLPRRYNALKQPPYIGALQKLQEGNRYRSYSLDGTPQPNFAMPFFFSSLNNVEALMPVESAEFLYRYIDKAVSPIWFAGNLSFGRDPARSALSEFFRNKRYVDLIGIKYLVTRGSSEPGIPLYDTEAFAIDRTPTPLFTPLETVFTSPVETIDSVQVLLSTYAKTNPGIVRLQITADRSGGLLRTAEIAGDSLKDNSHQSFAFEPITGVAAIPLRLRLEFIPSQPDSMIAAWVYPTRADLGFSFRILQTPLKRVYEDMETDVSIWENPDTVERVFLAPTAHRVDSFEEAIAGVAMLADLSQEVLIEEGEAMGNESDDAGSLEAFTLRPNDVEFVYHANTPGILTLTDTFAPGWRAVVNGVEAPVLRVNGAFRGVRIEQPGTHHVLFTYRPPHWNLILYVTAAGAVLLTAMTAFGFRQKYFL